MRVLLFIAAYAALHFAGDAGGPTPVGGSPEGLPARGISSSQQLELEQLLQANSEAIDELPAGHEAKDRLRLLRAKLESLRSVAADSEEHEWDAMLSALLDSSEYGYAELAPLLQGARAAGDEASCKDDASGKSAPEEADKPVGRRLRQVVEAPVAAAGPAAEDIVEGHAGWRHWLLARWTTAMQACDGCWRRGTSGVTVVLGRKQTAFGI